jgi:hypothetical protein
MISEWEYFVVDQRFGEPPVDVLIINNGYKLTLYKFQRFGSFCYHEKMRDYIFKYSPSFEFLTIFNYLIRNKSHCKLTYQSSNSLVRL